MSKTCFVAFQGKGKPYPIGSLVFTRDKGVMPYLVRWWTRRGAPGWEPGGFNHVAMQIGPDVWLSAEPSGVKARTFAELTRRSEVFVVFYYGNDRVSFMAAQEACRAANGKRYDFVGCLGFILNRLTGVHVSSRANWFCSELCACAWLEAMARAGVPHEYRDPTDTTPNDLARWAMSNGFMRFHETTGTTKPGPK